MTLTLEANLARVRSRIDTAARRSGRRGEEIALVAVTKTVAPEVAAELVRLGQKDLGESRADELERKDRHLRASGLLPRWHFVGHLQRNKVRRVVALAASIHSIDSRPLLEAVDRAAGLAGTRPEVWIQVKLTDEAAKTGSAPEQIASLYETARSLPNVQVAGLMAIAPFVQGPAVEPAARAVFRELAALARELAQRGGMGDALLPGRVRTSMGMSGDFEWAIEEGSDLVRVGSLILEGRA